MNSRRTSFVAFVSLLLIVASTTLALVKADLSLQDTFKVSREVLVAKVASIDADHNLIEADVTEALKAGTVGEHIRVQISSPQAILKKIAVGQPLVILAPRAPEEGKKEDERVLWTVHVADTWLLAKTRPGTKFRHWEVVSDNNKNMAHSFPGRTTALVKLLTEFKTGKSTILNAAENKVFTEAPRALAKVDVKDPTSMLAITTSAESGPQLLIAAPDHAQLLSLKENGTDTTEKSGLTAASGLIRAAGDVNGDGKPDFLIGNTLWLSNGEKYTAGPKLELPPDNEILAATIVDVTNDKKLDVLVLKTSGELLVFENPGTDKSWTARPARALWKDDATPPIAAAFGEFGEDAETCVMVVREGGITRYSLSEIPVVSDIARLTGDAFTAFSKKVGPLKDAIAVTLDINGDGRRDLMIVGPEGSLILVNRGFGVFLPIVDAGAGIRLPGAEAEGIRRPPHAQITAADMHNDKCEDLLLLTSDGQLHELNNPPAVHAK